MPDPLRQGLAEMGFAEGRNVSVEYRSGSSRRQLTALAADLVLRRPAVSYGWCGVGGQVRDANNPNRIYCRD
jgi:hypothetical protein